MKKQQQLILNSQPKDFGIVGNVGQYISNTPWAKIQTYYFDIVTYQLPMTAAEVAAALTGTVKLFSVAAAQTNRQTNSAANSSVNDLFLAMGVGIVAISEGMSFSLPGGLIGSDNLTADPDIPVPGCQSGTSVLDPASYWYGGPGWILIEKFFRSYNLQVIANGRVLLVDESLEDVGMSPLPAEFIGASSSRVPAMPFIRKTNDHLITQSGAAAFQFLPQNVDPTGGVDGGSTCVPPPDAGVTYGHPCITGLAQRIYPFVRPILFAPGMQWEMNLVPSGTDCDTATMEMVAQIFVDTASSLQANAVQGNVGTNRTVVLPGGCVSLGVVVKGVSLWPSACIDFLSSFWADLPAIARELYATNPTIMGIVNKYPNHPKMTALQGLLSGAPQE